MRKDNIVSNAQKYPLKHIYNMYRNINTNKYITMAQCVRVFNSGLPMQYHFEHISNDIPCVNCFPLSLITLNSKLQIPNHYCDPNI